VDSPGTPNERLASTRATAHLTNSKNHVRMHIYTRWRDLEEPKRKLDASWGLPLSGFFSHLVILGSITLRASLNFFKNLLMKAGSPATGNSVIDKAHNVK